ncbi:MAG: hypothetical protein ACXABY_26160, partial [Candidatus Thorarchaeota archaeon]
SQEGILAVTGEFASPTATGTQKIAHGLGETPALIILFSSMVEYGSTSRASACLSHGAMDSSGNEMTGGFRSDDGADPTDNSSWQYNNKVIFMQDPEGATQLDAECGVTAWDNDFFYIDWNTVDSTQYRISFVAIARVTAKVGTFTQQAGTGTQDVSIGFQPDVIMFQGGAVTVNTPQADIRHFFGQANNNEDCNTMSVCMEDNVGTTDTAFWAATTISNLCIIRIDDTSFGSSALDEADISATGGWPSDGFELNWAVNNGDQIPIGYIAISGVESFIDYDTEPTGVAPQDLAVTGAGFQGELLIIHTPAYSWGGVGSHAYISVGYARTPQYEVACAVRDEHLQGAADGSVTHRNNRVHEKLNAQTGAVRSSAELKQWDSDGFTLTFQTTTDISAQPFQFMVLKRGEIEISEFEAIAVTESISVALPDALGMSESDTVTVTDISFINIVFNVDVFDSTSVQEDVTVNLESLVSVFDGVTVADIPTVSLPDALLVDVFDGATATDVPTIEVGIVSEYNVSVFDETSVTDVPVTALSDALVIVVFDTVTVAEFADAFILNYFISVFDTITVSELVEVAPQLKIDVFDTTAVTESTSVILPDALVVSVFDTVTVVEDITVTVIAPEFHNISVFETVTVTESTAGIVGTVILSTFDVITVTEDVDIYWIVSKGVARMEAAERAPDIEFVARAPRIDYVVRS